MKKKAPKGWVKISDFEETTGISAKTITAAIKRGYIPDNFADVVGTSATSPYYLNPQQAAVCWYKSLNSAHPNQRKVRNALAAVFLLLLLLFLSLFQWYQRADTRLEDIAAQNGWDCLGAADRLATHLKRGTYDYMNIDAIARFDETAQHAQQPTGGQLGEVLVELENEIAFTAIPPREMQKITAYLNGLTGPPHQRRCWRSPPSFA